MSTLQSSQSAPISANSAPGAASGTNQTYPTLLGDFSAPARPALASRGAYHACTVILPAIMEKLTSDKSPEARLKAFHSYLWDNLEAHAKKLGDNWYEPLQCLAECLELRASIRDTAHNSRVLLVSFSQEPYVCVIWRDKDCGNKFRASWAHHLPFKLCENSSTI